MESFEAVEICSDLRSTKRTRYLSLDHYIRTVTFGQSRRRPDEDKLKMTATHCRLFPNGKATKSLGNLWKWG